MQQKLLTPEQIAAQAQTAIPNLRLPQRSSVFADRAARLRYLAAAHPMAGYLEFCALLADAQQSLLRDAVLGPLTAPVNLLQPIVHGLPPLDFQNHTRSAQWRYGLRRLLHSLTERTSGRQYEVASALERQSEEFYEAQASKLLAGVRSGLDVASAPFIGAALQAYFTHLVIELGGQAFPRTNIATLCPCCGSRPTASVVRIGGTEDGYRFLHCALCNAQWHMVRIKCSNCESTRGISYQRLDDGSPAQTRAVAAEVCEECGTYLKICYMDRDPLVEPVADDLASLPLDLLVASTGKSCSGVNFLLIHGESESA